MFRAALQVVISDFFHLRLGASVGVISKIATVHLSVGGGGGGGWSTGFQFK